ncbi:hypothetical protein [Mangrovivirga cuniculi]|uniref:Uncharacterized protein n=1 Tax=Mangrovivirga cuniculi TaxID=2715131 RepID=A0A4D7JIU6_9BACT|nr:hypothetical protein [Mangrovivirga cuniculi]QCK14913.1 hypothetical protein DCC35_09255 [Mangrovivirga cuniculi]
MINKSIFIFIFILFAGSFFEANAQGGPDDDNLEAIDSLALEKIRDLSKYISIIGSKATPFSEANRVIDRALELFAEGSEVGVSSVNSDETMYYAIKEYFGRLMALNYDQVNITWFDIQYISDLQPLPNGEYVGVITIYQKFEGVSGDNIVYKDTTKKDITVYVKKKETQIGGDIVSFWDVLLGDIMVSETM